MGKVKLPRMTLEQFSRYRIEGYLLILAALGIAEIDKAALEINVLPLQLKHLPL